MTKIIKLMNFEIDASVWRCIPKVLNNQQRHNASFSSSILMLTSFFFSGAANRKPSKITLYDTLI